MMGRSTQGAPGQSRGGVVAGAPLLPQINLLPDWVRQKRALARTKGVLAVAVALVLVLALLGYVAATVTAAQAEKDYQAAQAETTRLLAEQATYSEVPAVLGQIQAAKDAQIVAMGHEVLWKGYLEELMAALPKGSQLGQVTSISMSPTEFAPAPVDQLLTQGIGTLTLVSRSTDLPDTADWLDALAKVKGFSDPRVSAAAITEDDGDVYYEVTSTVELTVEAYSGRFQPKVESK